MVERTGSLGVKRPFESIRWEAKMVLIRVDFPRPVWPIYRFSIKHIWPDGRELTNTHNIELEATFQQLPFNLRSNAIETDMAPGEDRRRGGACSGHGGGVRGIRRQGFSGRRDSQWKELDRKIRRKQKVSVQPVERNKSSRKIGALPQE